jgi:uncharacterized protein YecE (DUF72 family)
LYTSYHSLTEYFIGAGGWNYFKIPDQDSLKAYSKVFNFVEVNSTFYKKIPYSIVEFWRKRVPPNFEFSVRLNQIASHKNKLEPTQETCNVFDYTKKICDILRSRIIVIETPETLEFTPNKISAIKDVFESISLDSKRIAWETRTGERRLPMALLKLMEEENIVPISDLSIKEPLYRSDQLYSRLFGKGRHNIYQFTDEELQEIHSRTKKGRYNKVVLSFHGIKMYKDAYRYQTYLRTGHFPSITRHLGLNALKSVLEEDTRFPISKEKLIAYQGWKVIDITKEKRVRAKELLAHLPQKTYYDTDEVIDELR